MSNDINTVKARGGVIAKMAAGFLADHVQFVKTIDKADPSDFDGKNGYKAGDTVKVPIPAQFTLGTGADITSTIQDVDEDSVNLTVNNQYNVPIAFTSAEIATDFALKSWGKRVLEPAMITLANNIEKACLEQASDAIFNSVGTPGSSVFDTDLILSAGQKMDESGCDDYDNRFVLLNPAANRSAVNARKGLFQQSDQIAKQYKNGAMGVADGFTFLRNNLVNTHTNGNDVSGVAVEADVVTPATGATTLGVDGLTNTTGTVKKGTVFTIADVYAVHPVTKATLSHLQQFVVTADATANGSGQATLSISPTIYSTGPKQNVSALPVDEAALTFLGSASTGYTQNLAYHKSAFRFVSLPLVKPDGVDMVAEETKDGISVRIVRAFDIKTDKMIMRADVLWGMANVRPEWGCRLFG
jgi:hypothetical protein